MNARRSEGNVARTQKRILGLAGLAGLVGLALACAGPAAAQSKPAQAEITAPARPIAAAPATSSGVGSSPAMPAAKQAVAQNSPAKPSARKGQQEGIKVHGHWTIEVRNPDGSVVRHVEFENSLDPGFSFPTAPNTGVPVPGGANLLNSMLSGLASPSANDWGVMLVGPAGLVTPQSCVPGQTCVPPPPALFNTTNAPCLPTVELYLVTSNPFPLPQIDACMLFQPPIIPPPKNDQGAVNGLNCSTPLRAGINCNLVTTPIGTAPNLTGFQLSGSVTASPAGQTGQISDVAIVNFGPCVNVPLGIDLPNCAFLNNPLVSLTSSYNPPGLPITVSSGQTVSVSVAISFQ